MAQVVPGVAEVRMQYKSDSEKCENVYHVEHGPALWSEGDLETLLTLFLTWENDVAKLHRCHNTALVQLIGTDLTSLSGFRVVTAPDIPVVGSLPGDGLPNNATIAIHADIGTRGRGKSGRVFFIGLEEGQVTADNLSAGAGGELEDDMNSLRTTILAHDPTWKMCVPHRVVAGVRPEIAGFTDIRAWNLSDFTIDSMKLRLPNHKKHKKAPLR